MRELKLSGKQLRAEFRRLRREIDAARCRTCAYCGQTRQPCENESFMRCSQCLVSHYCSRDHQKRHWAVHRTFCTAFHDAEVGDFNDDHLPVTSWSHEARRMETNNNNNDYGDDPMRSPDYVILTRRYLGQTVFSHELELLCALYGEEVMDHLGTSEEILARMPEETRWIVPPRTDSAACAMLEVTNGTHARAMEAAGRFFAALVSLSCENDLIQVFFSSGITVRGGSFDIVKGALRPEDRLNTLPQVLKSFQICFLTGMGAVVVNLFPNTARRGGESPHHHNIVIANEQHEPEEPPSPPPDPFTETDPLRLRTYGFLLMRSTRFCDAMFHYRRATPTEAEAMYAHAMRRNGFLI